MSHQDKEFVIEFIAVNESRFYAPVPVYRLAGSWQPTANLDLDVITRALENDQHEVDLKITVKVSIEENHVFDVEVVQTGAFTIKGYQAEDLQRLLSVFCPTVLYPYARETVANLVAKAGFPQLHLSPVDFEARYQALNA